ncbi:MAG TPA: tripartite tricarboxylate transporter substrate binding protein [Burkholderiales bacterium]|nr:tripartite tricarboxylate transporter substrate binding protein [Burkholderiales bacterium]
MVRFLIALLVCTSAWAQYPSRAIRLFVPNPPGGATDTLARVFAPKLGEVLGQPIVVENRPGSNGNMASETTARAAPDGHTLLLCADAQIVIGPHLYAKMPLDTLKDLEPVSTLASTQMILSVSPTLPVKNLQEFLDYARRARPPLAYASIGNGSQHHLVMEMLKARAGIDLLHVPFKGGGPATVALLSGEVSVMFGGNSVAGHIKSGRMLALAVAGKERSASYPELPRLGELYPDLEVTPWLALFAPSGLPAPVLLRLRTEAGKLLADADVREKIRNVGGLEPYVTKPEEFAALLRAEYAKYGQIVKAAGAKID